MPSKDHPLNPRQIRFVDLLLAGRPQQDAYAEAYGRPGEGRKCRQQASDLVRQPHVAHYLETRRVNENREIERRSVMSRLRKEEILSDIAQSPTEDTPNRIAAIKVHNSMAGHDAPKVVKNEVSILSVLATINAGDAGFVDVGRPEGSHHSAAIPVDAEDVGAPSAQSVESLPDGQADHQGILNVPSSDISPTE